MMASDNPLTPEDDIRQALESAAVDPGHRGNNTRNTTSEPLSDAIAVTSEPNALSWGRFAAMRCGLMVEKYPWQTTALLVTTVGCGWLCVYFGLTMLAALVLFAVFADE